MLKGIGAIPPAGVHHRCGRGKLLFALVVVGDDDVQPQALGVLSLLDGGDAAVYSDDDRRALFSQPLHRPLVQAVALLQTIGDIGQNFATLAAEEIGKQTGGGNAVHIIIPIDGDGLALLQSGLQPFDGLVHVGHLHRVMKLLPLIEQPPGPRRIGNAPGGEDLGA